MNPMTRNAIAKRYIVTMIATMLCLAGTAMAGPPAAAGSDNVPVPGQVFSGTVSDLQQLIDSHQLTELRTTYNSSYGASLLFNADKLSYYVALFHGKDFWRVIQTSSYDDAESIYRTFVTQTQQLAQADIDSMRLEANKKFTEHLVAMNEQRLQNMQKDASYQQEQARQVAALQQQAQQRTVALTTDLRESNSQLDAVQQQIRALEVQQANPSLVLPTAETAAPAAPVPATAPAAAAPTTSALISSSQ